MILELNVTEESFENEKKELITYYSYEIELGGKKFKLYPKDADKKLLNYLIEQKLA